MAPLLALRFRFAHALDGRLNAALPVSPKLNQAPGYPPSLWLPATRPSRRPPASLPTKAPHERGQHSAVRFIESQRQCITVACQIGDTDIHRPARFSTVICDFGHCNWAPPLAHHSHSGHTRDGAELADRTPSGIGH